MEPVIKRALAIRQRYAGFEKETWGREWTTEEIMLGFMKDVGDLSMLIQAKEGVRAVDNVDEQLRHELNDCLWSIIVLANKYDVDLERSFNASMDDIEARMKSQFKSAAIETSARFS